MNTRHAFVTLSLAAVVACQPAKPAETIIAYNNLVREDFNRRTAEKFLPLFWREDTNRDGVLQPSELAILWGYGDSDPTHWVNAQQKFTPQFDQAYRSMVQPDGRADSMADSKDDQERHKLVLQELAQGRPTLVETDLTHETPANSGAVRHLMTAAQGIERIYAKQKGVSDFAAQIPATDPASRMLFYRNQSPFCEAPMTENNPNCSALPMKPPRIFGLYPAGIQSDSKFCDPLPNPTPSSAVPSSSI